MSEYGWVVFCVVCVGIFAFSFNICGFQDITMSAVNNVFGSSQGNGNSGSNNDNGELSSDAKLANSISNAIEPSNSFVRSYALSAIKSSNSGNYNIGQICDIYDKVYNQWVYVNDPKGSEYFAPAGESVRLLRGDCDDYAVLMASLIESIGGTARVATAYNSNDGTGHAYAEVYVSDSKSDVEDIIDSIGNRYGRVSGHYRGSSDGGYWMNLDWTAKYPGGEYYKSTGTTLLIEPNGYYYRIKFT